MAGETEKAVKDTKSDASKTEEEKSELVSTFCFCKFSLKTFKICLFTVRGRQTPTGRTKLVRGETAGTTKLAYNFEVMLHVLLHLQENNESLYSLALKTLGNQIRASTTSMTSVPKPLKFMKPHYGTMKEIYAKLTKEDIKKECADIISVLAMTMGEGRECLKYRLLSDINGIRDWGHEYVR